MRAGIFFRYRVYFEPVFTNLEMHNLFKTNTFKFYVSF
jgi:hypothetical protein